MTAASTTAALLGLRPSSDINSGSPVNSGLPHPTPSAFRVSHPLDGLLPPEPAGFVSRQRHSWGFHLQGFPPSQSLQPLSGLASFL